jgi:acetaldehyde dehydrogenase/alcohol dehydrogenase
VRKGAAQMQASQPDVIIALGGGSPMDAAKIMWVMYEHPETHFEELALRFMDIRKRIHKFPKMGVKAKLVAITTTSGTGSEVTPFAVVTDDKTGQKYPLADYALTPNMAIVDANLVMNMPKSLTAFGGLDAVTHALESYVSVLANEFSDGQALKALTLLKDYLPASYHEGAKNPVARERVHNAATLAGIAFANAFLGVCHSMAHKLGSEFHIPHGLANALLICNVIRFNANDNPTKQTAFSQYDRPQARRQYAEIADHLGLTKAGDRTGAKIERLLAWLEEMKADLGIPKSIREAGVAEADFLAHLDKLSEDAFDDQCTGANPRYPLISEIKQLLLDSYYGREFTEQSAEPVAPKAEKKSSKK